jgi:hypothetical protein
MMLSAIFFEFLVMTGLLVVVVEGVDGCPLADGLKNDGGGVCLDGMERWKGTGCGKGVKQGGGENDDWSTGEDGVCICSCF